jgi:diguanylate cyclase (GGDEF)-like protein/PAS domain S-box-containing protein
MHGFRDLVMRLLGGTGRAKPSTLGPFGDTDFRMLAENTRDIICRIDPDNRPVYVSPAIHEMLGWTSEQAALGGIDFIHPEDQPMVMLLNERLFSGEIESGEIRYRLMSSAGMPVWVEASARRARHSDGTPGDLIIVMRDISHRKQLEDDLRAEALCDGLTGLPNRRSFDRDIEREWSRAVRSSGQISLLMIDIDHFKRYNDRFGHPAGDDCLRTIAATIRQSLRRPGDVAARYGGEEMAVILPGTSSEGACEIGETIRSRIETLRLPGAASDDASVTVSIGAATAPLHDGTAAWSAQDLLSAADRSLYRAKEQGRNRVVGTKLLLNPQPARA